jgi:hypothetical protein
MTDTVVITRNLPSDSIRAVKRVLADLGATVTAEHYTPGAVGYTTLTYTNGK